MHPNQAFASTYSEARSKFLEMAAACSLKAESWRNPASGPDGEGLWTDVVTLGAADAPMVLLANSATHGVEGFCGAGSLTGWLGTAPQDTIPEAVRVVLVHAINPYGFAWLRRVNEDNVDLNRNFITHGSAAGANPDYDALHAYLLPQRWDQESFVTLREAFAGYAREHGAMAAQAALSRGQYAHPDGVFFGGDQATWSNRTFREIVATRAAGARHLAFLDFHTGLGPFGHGELISKCAAHDPEFVRLREWFGPAVQTSAAGQSTSPMLSGLIAGAVRDAMPEGTVSALTVEYGTYPLMDILHAVVADNWLHVRGAPASAQGQQIKAQIKQMFNPDSDDWRELILVRSRQLINRALEGLARLA